MPKSSSCTKLDCFHHSTNVISDMVNEFQLESIARVPVFSAGMCAATVHQLPLDLLSSTDDADIDSDEQTMASCIAISPENTVVSRDIDISQRATNLLLRRRKKYGLK
jgi:hypothetical protein